MIKLSKARWEASLLVKGHLAALLLVLSWVRPKLQVYWDRVDATVFHTLNYSLAGHPWLQGATAVLCHWTMNLAIVAAMMWPLYLYVRTGKDSGLTIRLAHVVSFFLYMGVCLLAFEGIGREFLTLDRLSPSLIEDEVVVVSAAPATSFPCGLFTVLVMWTGFLWHYRGWRWGLRAFAFAVVAFLPKLASGAHWATDGLVGSVALAAILLTWAFGSPLLSSLVETVTPLLQKVIKVPPTSKVSKRPFR